MSAQRLHPFKGFPTVITHKLFPLSVDGLVSVQSARRDKSLPAYFTSVRPLSCVSPDVSCEVGAVAKALFTNGAGVGLLSPLLVIIVVRLERQGGVMQTSFQTGRRWDELFNVGFKGFQLLRVVTHPEVPVSLLLLLLDLRGLWMLLLHAATWIILLLLLLVFTVLGRRSIHWRWWVMVLLLLSKRRGMMMVVVVGVLQQLSFKTSIWLWL